MVQYTQHWLSHASNWGITMHGAFRVLKSFIQESGKLHAQHSAKCITDQLYRKLEVTCTTVYLYEEWEVTGAFRWTALGPQASLWDHLSRSKACCGSDVLCCLLLWPMFSVVVYSSLWELMFFYLICFLLFNQVVPRLSILWKCFLSSVQVLYR